MAHSMMTTFLDMDPSVTTGQADILSGHQYWSEHRRKSLLQPELELMLAVLEDALECYFHHGGAKTRTEMQIFCETERWFQSRNDDDVFSFENICHCLGIDPGYVRRGLAFFANAQRQIKRENPPSPGQASNASADLRLPRCRVT